MQRRCFAFLLCWPVFVGGAFAAETTGTTDVREHLRFDDDWRFHKGDIEGAQQPRFDDEGWRRLDLPHDWSIEDIATPSEEQTGSSPLYAVEGTWRFHKGDDMKWKTPALDDGAWESVRLPASWERHSDYTEPNAYGWYRRRIVVPSTMAGQDVLLALGKIDDVDETFFNGVAIGSTGIFPPDYESRWQEDRLYRVPRDLIQFGRENVIAVRVYDGSGDGGMYAATGPHRRSGPFDSAAPGARSTGYTVGGTAWYRKHFRLPADASGKQVAIRFDGVYMNADVWINGAVLGNHPYGYTSFGHDLTTHLNGDGRENVLAVRVRNEGKNSRWYSGSGIYRHVWLTITDPVHVAPWGTYVTTPQVGGNTATVVVQTEVVNRRPKNQDVDVAVRIVDPQGRSVAEQSQGGRVPANQSLDTTHRLLVPGPVLWSPESPSLYEAVTEIRLGGKLVDRTRTSFGIRTLAFDSRQGFLLNGRPTLLRGGCMHHDNGPLGAAAYDRAEERRVELMKAAGFNAIRCAHNPPSPAFLDACDRLGMLVVDEAFDHWNLAKNSDDYHLYFKQWWQRDIESTVRRDRNHPCVIMWSIGNEVIEQHEPLGARTAKALGDCVRTLDPTRPVTQAVCLFGKDLPWEDRDALFATLDVCGYNYRRDRYDSDHQRLPDRIIYCSESFPREALEYWRPVVEQPHIIGDFVWTGFDYLGEASIGWHGFSSQARYPWTVAYCGDLDLCGFKRPQSYYRDVVWGTGCKLSAFVHNPKPTFGAAESWWGFDDVHASWTWPGYEGELMKVDVYSACERVRLQLNGRDLGVKPTSQQTHYKATWEVSYEPGVLTAIGYAGNWEVARWQLCTVAAPVRVRLTADRENIRADGQDLCYVTAELVDDRGRRDPCAENVIHFDVAGPAILAAVGSARPDSVESFQQPQRHAFEGRCLLVIRAGRQAGSVRVKATSDGLPPVELIIHTAD